MGNKTYAPEEKYDDGCESRCRCVGDNKNECGPICTGPYFRTGSFSGDPYCFENPAPEEPCCAVVTCSSRDGDIELKLDPKQGIYVYIFI